MAEAEKYMPYNEVKAEIASLKTLFDQVDGKYTAQAIEVGILKNTFNEIKQQNDAQRIKLENIESKFSGFEKSMEKLMPLVVDMSQSFTLIKKRLKIDTDEGLDQLSQNLDRQAKGYKRTDAFINDGIKDGGKWIRWIIGGALILGLASMFNNYMGFRDIKENSNKNAALILHQEKESGSGK